MKSILLFLFTSILNSQLAISQVCDSELIPITDSKLMYQQRNNRCEGFYRSPVFSSTIDLVGVLQGKLNYEIDSSEVVEILSPIKKDLPIFVRAQAIPIKIYYRMDAKIDLSKKIIWPIRDVILPKNLSSSEVSIYGYLDYGKNKFYVPIKTKAKISKILNDNIIRVIFRPSIDIENVQYRWYSLARSEFSEWKQDKKSTYRSGMPIIINLPPLPDGLYEILVAGEVKNVSDEWVDSRITLLIGQP